MRLADAISLRSRERKLRLFLDELRPTPETSVLDVGADELGFGEGDGCGTLNFFEERYPWPGRITALGLHDGKGFRKRYPNIPYVQGDACALPFADGAFDVVFSNAVIEHVGGREQQRRLVSEAIRVGTARLHHDTEPALSDGGTHAPPARPLAAGARVAIRVPGGRARTSRPTCICLPDAASRRSSPAGFAS